MENFVVVAAVVTPEVVVAAILEAVDSVVVAAFVVADNAVAAAVGDFGAGFADSTLSVVSGIFAVDVAVNEGSAKHAVDELAAVVKNDASAVMKHRT